MTDLISRQKAIEALGEKPVGDTDWDLGCRNQWEWDTEILRTLPSAEPEERKTGHWIEDETGYGFWTCSECKFVTEVTVLYHFCPNCGARMTR